MKSPRSCGLPHVRWVPYVSVSNDRQLLCVSLPPIGLQETERKADKNGYIDSKVAVPFVSSSDDQLHASNRLQTAQKKVRYYRFLTLCLTNALFDKGGISHQPSEASLSLLLAWLSPRSLLCFLIASHLVRWRSFS